MHHRDTHRQNPALLYNRSNYRGLSHQQAAPCQHELGKRQARLLATAQHRHLQRVGGNVRFWQTTLPCRTQVDVHACVQASCDIVPNPD